MTRCFLILGFMINLAAQAQVLPGNTSIIKARDLSPGVYFTFDDFRHNAPGMGGDSLRQILSRADSAWSGSFFEPAQLRRKATQKEIEYNGSINYALEKQLLTGHDSLRHIWGYHDGQDIFCLHDQKFYRMTFIGRYSVLEFYREKYLYKGKPGTSLIALPKVDHVNTDERTMKVDQVLLDVEAGEFFPLNEYVVKILLQDDPELLAIFLKDNNRKGSLLDYVIRYDFRHPVNFDPPVPVSFPGPGTEVKW